MIVELTKDNYAQIKGSGKPMLIEFYKEGCNPCEKLEPALVALEKKYGGNLIVVRSNLNTGGLAQKYQITQAPYLALLDKNGELNERLNALQQNLGSTEMGPVSLDYIERRLSGYLKSNGLNADISKGNTNSNTLENRVENRININPNQREVLARRYLKRDETGNPTEEPEQLFRRVSDNISLAEKKYGKSDDDAKGLSDEFYRLLTSFDFMPNSPTLMNAGKGDQQLSACFVLPIEDDMKSIAYNGVGNTAMIHKSGGGTGFSFSNLRPENDHISTTYGKSSGPVTFMDPIDRTTEAVNQGGFRRGANMGILTVYHPDIRKFIGCKSELDLKNQDVYKKIKKDLDGVVLDEDSKESVLNLVKTGLVSKQLNNFNISVALTDDFMDAVKNNKKYSLINPRNKKVVKEEDANEIFNLIAENAWKNGEPGVIFINRINKDNPTPQLGKIEATNPCVVANTLISTEDGLIKIKDIVKKYGEGGIKIVTDRRIPIKVMGYNGNIMFLAQDQSITNLRPISCAFYSGIKPVYKLLTKSGFELELTADHKIFTLDGKKRLIEIKPYKDRVLIQCQKGSFSKNIKLPFNVKNEFMGLNGKRYKLNLPKIWSKELGQIMGWLIGDGWLRDSDKDCRVGFTFGKDDKPILDYLKPIINNFYGSNIKEVQRENGVIHLSYHSKYFIRFFKKLGINAKKADQKVVPKSIFIAPEESVIGFIQGLFSADGTLRDSKKSSSDWIALSSKSLRLLKQVQLLLLNLGIKSRIFNRSRKRRNKVFIYKNKIGQTKYYSSDGVLYELGIFGESIELFKEKIGFISNIKQNKLSMFKFRERRKTLFSDLVISIKFIGEKKVYDLTEPATHSMVCNSIIATQCGEQPLLPYEACNLGSINLNNMVKDGVVDYKKLEHTIRTAVHFLDNVIDMSRFPKTITKELFETGEVNLDKISDMVRGNRKIGLGIMGFADMLVRLGVPYASEKALEIAEEVMSFIDEKGKEASIQLANERGTFPNIKDSIYDPESKNFKGKDMKLRNATVTTIAPTGSISMIADCSSGIEPNYSLFYIKTVMDGTRMRYLVNGLEDVLKQHNLYNEDLMKRLEEHGSFNDLDVPKDIKELFQTAHDVSPEWHVRMQAAFQKYTDNAVSKTINLPEDSTVEDVKKIYLLAYELGCKGITVYRDKSRSDQVLTSVKKESLELYKIKRGKLTVGPMVKIPIGQDDMGKDRSGFFYIGMDEYGRPIETFMITGKSGGQKQADNEAIGRAVSKLLQNGTSLEDIAEMFGGIKGDSPGYEERVVIHSSADGLARIAQRFLEGEYATVMKNAVRAYERNVGSKRKANTANIDKQENRQETQTKSKKEDNNEIKDVGANKEPCPSCNSTSYKLIVQEGCTKNSCCGYSHKSCG